jgi:hypothetical protein
VGDIFREVDEELRQERLEKAWKAYGNYAIGAVVALLLAIGAARGWQEYSAKQRQAESAQFAAAANLAAEGKQDEAAALFAALAEKGGRTYGALARFHQAALKIKAGDAAGGIALYDAIARDDSVEKPLRDAALLLGTMHAADQPSADAPVLAARLEPLIAGGGPWRNAASELAGILAIKAGDTAKARERFKAIADDADAPANLRARAAELLALLGN